jgi:hypothetical protein
LTFTSITLNRGFTKHDLFDGLHKRGSCSKETSAWSFAQGFPDVDCVCDAVRSSGDLFLFATHPLCLHAGHWSTQCEPWLRLGASKRVALSEDSSAAKLKPLVVEQRLSLVAGRGGDLLPTVVCS